MTAPVIELESWFRLMASRYCGGRDYGSVRRNAYHFYRVIYRATASEAWRLAKQLD